APTTTDACSGTITGTTTDALTYSTQGTHVITWSFDDGNGNSTSAAQNVVIDDVTPPVTPTLADVTGECTATAVAPTTTDACAGTITGTTTDAMTYSTQGTHVITWTFDDGNGNSTSAAQNVVIDDVTPPVTPTLTDVTGECSATAVAPTTTDACAGIITGTTTDAMTYSTQGTHVITWTFDDGNGNSTSAAQNVVIDDVTPPVTPTLTDVTGECSATAVAPTTTDACAGTITGTTTDALTYSTQGIHVITWTFDDGNGNSTTATQNVVIDDVTAPLIPTLTDMTGECTATAVAPTTTDACSGTITGTTTDALTYSIQGIHVITWTFDDGNGNSITVTQNVIIDDVSPPEDPELADVLGECSATAVAPIINDACAGPITGTTTDDLTYSTQGTHVINWTFTDASGNSITVAQNVVIEDVTAPSATCPEDVITCDGFVNSIGLTNVTDNCTIPAVTFDLSGATTGSGTGDASGEIFNPGVTTVTYTIDDGNGNSSQCVVSVTNSVVGDISVSIVENSLIVETIGTYQWINCADNSIIAGQTESTFTPTENGEYAVIVTQGECTDTSDCLMLTISGLGKNGGHQDFKVYPMPAEEFLTIDMGFENTNATIKVVNIIGQTVVVKRMLKLTKTDLDVSRFETGVYLIHIDTDQMNGVSRIIKE
ncbi:MAG: T9SS type A sorting domain-containing protein, partial [Bacteroidales bacterium]|nr:T9SS type A sorting domain-containing protein [Bacteroidales bacterium]